jgi:hypothetical protein
MILFFGDYAAEKKRILSKNFKKQLLDVQYVVLNYEGTSLAIHNKKLKKRAKGYSPLINDDLIIEIIKQGSKVICNLSNNHSLDYGIEGYHLTTQHLQSLGCFVIGPKSNKNNVQEHCRIKFGNSFFHIVSAADKSPGEPLILSSQVLKIRYKKALNIIKNNVSHEEKKILYFHSGLEFIKIPNPSLVRKINKAVELGCDHIFVHHQHTILPIQKLNKTFVAFGLGNMAFDCYMHDHYKDAGVGLGVGVLEKKENKLFKIHDHKYELDLLEINSMNFFKNQNLDQLYTYKKWAKAAYMKLMNINSSKTILFTQKKSVDFKLFSILKKIFKKYYWIKFLRMLRSENGRDLLLGALYYKLTKKNR